MDIDLEIKTPRLYLRPISMEDLDRVYECSSNPEIPKYMSWNPHENKEETRTLITRLMEEIANDKSYTWSIFYEERFCGIFSLIAVTRTHRALTYNRAELAYWLDPEYQKKGIMTESGDAIINYAFNNLNIHRLVVSHVSENESSEKLIKRLKFRYIGEEYEAFCKNGVWHNHKLYERIGDVR